MRDCPHCSWPIPDAEVVSRCAQKPSQHLPSSVRTCDWGIGDFVADSRPVLSLATLASLLAPGYVHTDFEGRVLRRAEWLAYAEAQGHGSSVEFDDVEIIEHGDFGLVIGANRIKGGSMGSSTIRFTQVWRCDELGWKRLAFQATQVRKPG